MSTKVLFKTMVPLGLLVLFFLAAQIVSSKSASVPAAGDAVTVESMTGLYARSVAVPNKIDPRSDSLKSDNLAGSDWIERHPSNYYAGSDYIERHPSVDTRTNYFAGSDYIERHPSNYFAGSDWIERHPPVVTTANYFAGSDWIERHPSNYYAGSDWIERHR